MLGTHFPYVVPEERWLFRIKSKIGIVLSKESLNKSASSSGIYPELVKRKMMRTRGELNPSPGVLCLRIAGKFFSLLGSTTWNPFLKVGVQE